MRKNSVRKFVHMAIDILPLLIIPIFAININQKSVDPISIDVEQEVFAQSNYVETYEDIKIGNIYYWNDTIVPNEFSTREAFSIYCDVNAYKKAFPQYEEYDITLVRFYHDTNLSFYNEVRGNGFSTIYQNVNGVPFNFLVINLANIDLLSDTTASHIKYTDYKYSLGIQTVTYDDTDIGSQFLYSLYKPVQDYFNFNNLFNMGQIYDWIQLNLFSGTAPLPIFIIWNIIVYEFFVDLIFLLYALFMFVIDFATCMIDSFMGKARKGV